ncbi:MAG: bifunctional glutamate N-acetyltransferase/amino-acid acetyltransferase ArgJ [Pseudomonadota bacterium]
MSERSPFAPSSIPDLPAIAGVDLFVAKSGETYQGRNDLLLVEFAQASTIAGVTTSSRTRAAPIDHCRAVFAGGKVRGLLVNAGNANAFTGDAGRNSVDSCAGAMAYRLGCQKNEIAIASTGVIGKELDHQSLIAAISREALQPADYLAAASSIMTTDTFPKLACSSAQIAGAPVAMAGIAKGAGMIAPNMATMLCFIFTDARLPASILQSCLQASIGPSFNAISVDGDTSTSDLCLIAATGRSDHGLPDDASDPILDSFKAALGQLCHRLAMQIIGDGEGVSKLIEVEIYGALNDDDARLAALSVINSPLVKVACAARDANWGRVVMAVGKSGAALERDRMAIDFGDVPVARNGRVVDEYDEARLTAYLQNPHLVIRIDLGLAGSGQAKLWGNDLTERYLAINGSYRS